MVVVEMAATKNTGPSKSSFDVAGNSAEGPAGQKSRRRPPISCHFQHLSFVSEAAAPAILWRHVERRHDRSAVEGEHRLMEIHSLRKTRQGNTRRRFLAERHNLAAWIPPISSLLNSGHSYPFPTAGILLS
jgi:hypothetical protein